jgi:hypothetical protein
MYSYSDNGESTIEFQCPEHGLYKLNLSDPLQVQRLEFNMPLRNILRAKVFARDPDVSWIRVPGMDYVGLGSVITRRRERSERRRAVRGAEGLNNNGSSM